MLLKQGQYEPLSIEDQVMVIFSGVRGYLKTIPLASIGSFETNLLEFVNTKKIFSPFVHFLKDDLKNSEIIFDKVLKHFIDSEFVIAK